jgi:hypothetical protein
MYVYIYIYLYLYKRLHACCIHCKSTVYILYENLHMTLARTFFTYVDVTCVCLQMCRQDVCR